MSAAIIDIESAEVVAEMTPECARDLTDRIKVAATSVADMLHAAHQGNAWKALGYGSWKEYVTTEFKMSERHSFRLLDFVDIKRDLATDQLVSPPVSESQVRALKAVPREKRASTWNEAVKAAGLDQPTAKQVLAAATKANAGAEAPAAIDGEYSDEEWSSLLGKSKAWKLAQEIIGLLDEMPTDDQVIHEALMEIEKKTKELRAAAWGERIK